MNKRRPSSTSTTAHSQPKSPTSPTLPKGTPPTAVPIDPQRLTPAGVLQLQRTLGNRAVGNLLRRIEGPPSPSPHASTDQPPLQRVFNFIGTRNEIASGPIQQGGNAPSVITSWGWVDTDTNTVYIWKQGLKMGPLIEGTGIPAFVMVMRTDGFTLFIEPTNKEGKVWKVVGNEDEELKKIRLNQIPYEREKKQPRPTMTPSDSMDLTMEEEDPGTTSFTKGTPSQPNYEEKFEKQVESKGYRNIRLEHDLTTQMHLIPLKQGQGIGMGNNNNTSSKSEPSDYVYTAAQIGVANVLIGDTDRTQVGTHLEPPKGKSVTPQGKHTVAWALVRRSIMGLGGRTAADVLDHFVSAFALLKPLTQNSKEAQLHWVRINYPTSLDQLVNATLPIDQWQQVLSEIVHTYTQLYHLSEGALFKGSSTQRGESPAVTMFAANESRLAQGKSLINSKGELAEHALKLLELSDSLPWRSYAFATHHWIDALVLTYPHVMQSYGKAITDGFLNKKVSGKGVPKGVKTIRQLVTHFKYPLPDFAKTEMPVSIKGELSLTPFTLQDLKADFVANVAIIPIKEGQGMDYSVTEGTNVSTIKVRGYTVDDLVIQTMQLSDNDRPPTKFLDSQKSHTVAWTLVRHDLFAYAQGPLSTLLAFLQKSFTHLEGDSGTDEGVKLAQHATLQLANYDTKRFALHDWQQYVSILVKWYAHAYQQAKSASFADPSTLGRALSHGEGPHMAALRRNETSLVNNRNLIDTPQRVVKAAVALFDLCIPKTKNLNQSLETNFMNAYDHWKDLLTHTYPEVLKVGWSSIYDGLANEDVGWKLEDSMMRHYLTQEMINKGQGQVHKMSVILKRNGRNK